jgi:RNA polymerase sigma factor (sigma-70 family)
VQDGLPEQLFERYRERGDVDALGELFDLTAPELLSLAVRLAPTVAEAEDLVQTTFLALIERPQAFKRGARLMPFLVGILARQAGTARRRARRSPDMARLAQREAERPENALLAAEVDDQLKSALQRVPELYREVLRQHLLEGRRPVEIALRLGRTPGTVAQQLLRGLEQLRRVLPRGLSAGIGGGVAVLLATRGEAAVRVAVMHRATELAGASLGVGFSLVSIGGAIVSVKSTAALAALSAALLVWLAWPDSAARTVEPVTASVTPEASPLEAGDVESPELATGRAPVAVAAPPLLETFELQKPSTAARDVTLVARLRGVAPEHFTEFTVEAQRGGEPVKGRFDSAGTARLAVGALLAAMPQSSREPLSVTAKHPRYLDGHELVHWTDAEATVIECVITPRSASVVSGRVRVPSGADVQLVRVELFDERGEAVSFPLWGQEGSCDADGRYEHKLTASGLHRLTATSPETLPFEVWCVLEARERLELPDIVLEAGGAEIHGSVRLPEGAEAQSFGGINVHAHWRGAPVEPYPRTVIDRSSAHSFAVLRGGPRPTQQVCALGEDHTFALRGLDAGPWELEVHGVAASALLPLSEPRIVHAPATGVVLWDDRCLLAVLVADAAGAVEGADVTWTFARGAETMTSQSQQTFTGGDGRASVIGDVAQDYSLTVRRTGSEPVQVPWPALGRGVTDTKRIEIGKSTASTLVLRLAPDSVELATANLRLEPKSEGKQARDLRATLEDACYRFDQLEPGKYRALLGPADDRGPVGFYGELVQTTEVDVDLAPGGTSEHVVALLRGGRVRVEVEAEPALDSWLKLELHGPDGIVRPFTGVARLSAGEGFGTFAATHDALHLSGSNAIQEALAPGKYELRRASDDWLVEAPTIEVRAGEVTTITLLARKR